MNDMPQVRGTVKGVAILSRRQKRPGDYLALGIATCGVGYLPIAPGTWGSGVGVALYLAFRFSYFYCASRVGTGSRNAFELSVQFAVLLFLVVLSFVGIWAASHAESLMARKDPGAVVIDEVVGQLITFLSVPLTIGFGMVIAGFFMFRAFDIWKPYPIRKLESLESGLGIMADDILAGAYSAVLLSALLAVRSAF